MKCQRNDFEVDKIAYNNDMTRSKWVDFELNKMTEKLTNQCISWWNGLEVDEMT